MPTIPVLSPSQSDEWDRRSDEAGISRVALMSAAGRAVASILAGRYPAAAARGVLVAAGAGSNGGDGWVAARALHRAGIPVWVACGPGERSLLCAAAAQLAVADGVREVPPDGPWPAVGIAVDALLGTGARGAPRPAVAALVERLADLSVPIVAVDGPTGLDLDTGVVHGSAQAALSITFGGVRRGHLLGRDEAGDIIVVDIGHSAPSDSWPVLVTDAAAAALLPRFRANFHKGDRGRIVIVGGAPGMAGAARMAARAAFAAGAGLVHVVAPAETIAVVAEAEPDVQTFLHPFEGLLSAALRDLIDRADCVILGPGLGRGEARAAFAAEIVSRARALVLDADGLHAFNGRVEVLRGLASARLMILTPHPGEFRSLFPALGGTAEVDPWGAAAAAAHAAGCAVLRKGLPTVIANPGGAVVSVAAGNPGLATGGSGDLLSGLIGTFVAQGLDASAAGAVGAQALGHAADIAARRHTARAMRPMDVIAALPDVWREWALTSRLILDERPPILLTLAAPQTT